MDDAQRDPTIGRRIANYEIVRKLGEGGMGVVYQATDVKLGRPVALKFLPPQIGRADAARERFLQEARAASALDHPNIGAIYGIEETAEGQMFIVMAYYAGDTLYERIHQGPLAIGPAIDFAIQVAQGLGEAHAQGIIHRDIKPSNIVVTKSGIAKIVDFGLAKLADSTNLTTTGMTMGTVAYMSPEQAAGRGDLRSDLWSLGVVLYEMLSGRLPFRGESATAQLISAVQEEPDPLPSLPDAVIRVVFRALSKNPNARYQNAAEMIQELMKAREDAAEIRVSETRSMLIQEMPSTGSRAGSAPAPKSRMRLATIVVAVVLAAALGLMAWRLAPWFGSHEKRVAVLPFTNVGGDAANAALCEGLVETLTGKLSTLDQAHGPLWVVPASEVRARNVGSPSAARRQFGVNLVVTGSVQRQGPAVRLIVSLVDAASMRQIGSRTLDDAGGDFAQLQDSAVTQLSSMLDLGGGSQGPGVERSIPPAAYEAYLKGLGYMQRYDKPGGLHSAIREFTSAIQATPQFALAQASLGEAYRLQYRVTKDPQWVQKALESCGRALEIDRRLAPAQVTLGLVQDAAGQRDLAIVHFQQALDLDPHSAEAIGGIARTYEAMGRLADAEAAFQKAAALRSNYWDGMNSLGAFYYRHARYKDAEVQFHKVLELTPDNAAVYSNLGVMLTKLGRNAEARGMYEKSIALSPTYAAYANLGNLHSAAEHYDLAVDAYRKALKLNDKDYRQWGSLARALEFAHGSSTEVDSLYERAATMAAAAIHAEPGDARALGLLATYEVHLKRNEAALDHVQQSLVRAPEDPEVLAQAAEVYEKLGRREEAVRWVQQAVAHGFSESRVSSTPELRMLRDDVGLRTRKK
jgi:serine/threonine-protein kinase